MKFGRFVWWDWFFCSVDREHSLSITNEESNLSENDKTVLLFLLLPDYLCLDPLDSSSQIIHNLPKSVKLFTQPWSKKLIKLVRCLISMKSKLQESIFL